MAVEMSECGSPVKVSQDSTQSSVDDVLSQAGVFGLVQNMVRITVCVLLLTTACHTGLVFFTGHSPPWKCSSTATRLVLCTLLTKCKSVLNYLFIQRFFSRIDFVKTFIAHHMSFLKLNIESGSRLLLGSKIVGCPIPGFQQ